MSESRGLEIFGNFDIQREMVTVAWKISLASFLRLSYFIRKWAKPLEKYRLYYLLDFDFFFYSDNRLVNVGCIIFMGFYFFVMKSW